MTDDRSLVSWAEARDEALGLMHAVIGAGDEAAAALGDTVAALLATIDSGALAHGWDAPASPEVVERVRASGAAGEAALGDYVGVVADLEALAARLLHDHGVASLTELPDDAQGEIARAVGRAADIKSPTLDLRAPDPPD